VLERLEQDGSVLEGHCLIDSSMYILMAEDPEIIPGSYFLMIDGPDIVSRHINILSYGIGSCTRTEQYTAAPAYDRGS